MLLCYVRLFITPAFQSLEHVRLMIKGKSVNTCSSKGEDVAPRQEQSSLQISLFSLKSQQKFKETPNIATHLPKAGI